MAIWEITLVDRPAIVVSVEDARNLAAEHDALVKAAMVKRPWWRVWDSGIDPYWHLTDQHRVHVAIVAGVAPVLKKRAERRPVIGFKLPDAGE